MNICRFHAEQYCKGHGLDVGAGKWVFKNARTIENDENEHAGKILESDNSQDFVFSSHCLEHVLDYQKVLDECTRVLKKSGVLYLYLPHPACSMWQPDTLAYHKQILSPNDIKMELIKRNYQIVDITYFPDVYFSFYVVAKKYSSNPCAA